ncbi:hypothetical protein BGX20_001255 [Mortierella sp. AD010]|nr:hypothetical protein BGX20_001255 [Mortierella sp. AD010]
MEYIELFEIDNDEENEEEERQRQHDVEMAQVVPQILMQTLGKEHMLWMNLRREVGAPWHRTRDELRVNEIEDESDNIDYRCYCCGGDGFYGLDDVYDSRDFIEEAYDLHKSRNRHHSRSDRKFSRFQKKAK